MGEGTYVRTKSDQTASNGQKPLRLPFDVPMLLIVAVLVIFGLLMVYSASWDFSVLMGKSPTYLFGRQVLWVVVGTVAAVILSFIDYHFYKKLLVPMIVGSIIMLLAVLIINDIRFNAARALLSGSIQPAEMAKMVIIIYLCFWLYNRRETLNDTSIGLVPMGTIIGLIAGLILVQPDISAAATILILGVMLFFLAGGDWKQLIGIGAIVSLLGWVVVNIYATGSTRIQSYLAGLRDPVEGSYHVRRAMEAVIKGGVFGVGIGKADTKFTGLPLPPTDSIFAVLVEETGIFGGFIVIALFILFIWRGLVIAKRAPDQLGSLLAFGLTAWIGIEAMMNMAVIVGLFPFTGNALPFFSAGGSSMVMCLASVGIIMNIARSSVNKETSERSPFSAVINLRGRDGRRRVPRHDHSANSES